MINMPILTFYNIYLTEGPGRLESPVDSAESKLLKT